MTTYRMPTQLALSGIAVIGLLASGCGAIDISLGERAESQLSEVFQTGATPTIVVETFNGSIDISPSDSNEVVVEVTKYATGLDQASAAARLDEIDVTIAQEANTIRVVARRERRGIGEMGAAVVISAPKDATVSLHTSNGAIVSEAMAHSVKAVTSNGKIEIVDGNGDLDLKTSNGAILIEASGAEVDARTSNGKIDFKGSLAAGKHEFRSSNGAIQLTLPADAQFGYSATTSNGKVRCHFEGPRDGNKRQSRLKGTVGGEHPATTIELSSSNGAIDIRRADQP